MSGKTYPYKDTIKALGGRFLGENKTWRIPFDNETKREIDALCKSVGGGPLKIVEESTQSCEQTNHLKKNSKESKLENSIHLSLQNQQDTQADNIPSNNIAAMQSSDLTISDLMNRVQLAITHTFPKTVWILGEIQNINFRKSGCFFNIAEKKQGASGSATITANATLWNQTQKILARKLGKDNLDSMLEDGLKVRILCQVGFYRDRGQITLNVMDLDPSFTKGALALAREQLLKKLKQSGMDQANKRLYLSTFPLKVGLISAEGSRAKSDFLDQLKTYRFPGEVIFFPAQMQGEATLKGVSEGIAALEELKCDIIVLTRGGGSAADLRWFDSEQTAMAIAKCKIPIIAAIGHHDDTCIAEEICYKREKTPTAAADFIVHIIQSTKELLHKKLLFLSDSLTQKVHQFSKIQNAIADKMHHTAIHSLTQRSQKPVQISFQLQQILQSKQNQLRQGLQEAHSKIDAICRQKLSRLEHQFELAAHQIHQISQQKTLQNQGIVNQKHNELLTASSKIFLTEQHKLDGIENQLKSQVVAQTQKTAITLQEKLFKIQQSYQQSLIFQEQKLNLAEKKLIAQDPFPWLKKGWTRLFCDQEVLTSGGQIKKGSKVRARVADANLELTVDQINMKPSIINREANHDKHP